ncbi:hypothetical protein AB0J83_28535 [Actinoplanes sp. NPDC049596]|uniref:hypothetical protein n=1 Tax=unclassified Actinoplanes TaxID=2626549 RepID=UPI00342175FF
MFPCLTPQEPTIDAASQDPPTDASVSETPAGAEVQLISDGDGLAVIGSPAAVERFLAAEELPSKDLDLPRLGSVLSTAAAVARAGSEIAVQSGRWVKLTAESAAKVRKFGLTPTKTPGVSHAMIGKAGASKSWLQIATGPGAKLSNPALLAGAAGIMAQLAMQQAMNEITDYLAKIDAKIDDVLRAQKDAVLAGMIGVDFVIDEALTVREHVGRVSDITWSKVQATAATIGQTQAYAVSRLDAVAAKLENQSNAGDLAKTARDAETQVQEWLAVLARCFQLQDALAVLELDRVLDDSPEELDRHRVGMQAARRKRLELISRTTEHLLTRMNEAAGAANTKVLLHPTVPGTVVQANNHVGAAVTDFRTRLGLESDHQSLKASRWLDAASDVRDKALRSSAEGLNAAGRATAQGVNAALHAGADGAGAIGRAGAEGVDAAAEAARRAGNEAANGLKAVTGKLAGGIAGLRRRKG